MSIYNKKSVPSQLRSKSITHAYQKQPHFHVPFKGKKQKKHYICIQNAINNNRNGVNNKTKATTKHNRSNVKRIHVLIRAHVSSVTLMLVSPNQNRCRTIKAARNSASFGFIPTLAFASWHAREFASQMNNSINWQRQNDSNKTNHKQAMINW